MCWPDSQRGARVIPVWREVVSKSSFRSLARPLLTLSLSRVYLFTCPHKSVVDTAQMHPSFGGLQFLLEAAGLAEEEALAEVSPANLRHYSKSTHRRLSAQHCVAPSTGLPLPHECLEILPSWRVRPFSAALPRAPQKEAI